MAHVCSFTNEQLTNHLKNTFQVIQATPITLIEIAYYRPGVAGNKQNESKNRNKPKKL